jgi:hypothetical protein
MKAINLVGSLLVASALCGCMSLIPKPVEFGEKKVQAFPTLPESTVQAQCRVALRAKISALQTVEAAEAEHSSTNVLNPARNTVNLTDALSGSLGEPRWFGYDSDTNEAAALRRDTGKQQVAVRKFAAQDNKVAGKKIEGTGFLSVPYFLYVGLILLALVIGFGVLKIFLTVASVSNPGAAVGVGALNVAGSVVSKGFSQLVQGGEDFKNWVETEISDSGLKQKILDAFTSSHQKAQDEDVQTLVKTVTK